MVDLDHAVGLFGLDNGEIRVLHAVSLSAFAAISAKPTGRRDLGAEQGLGKAEGQGLAPNARRPGQQVGVPDAVLREMPL
jgi:hypothetical protein